MPLELELAERFRFFRLSPREKAEIADKLRRMLSGLKEVSLAIIYGSFLKEYPFRDIDVAIYIGGGNVDQLDYKLKLDTMLSEYLRYPVDVKILNNAPPWFTRRVLEDGKLLFNSVPFLGERLYLKAIDEGEVSIRLDAEETP